MKILIVKTSAIGDVIQTFPTLAYLRTRYPEAQIDWVVEQGCSCLLKAHPMINRVLVIDTKKWRKQLRSQKIREEVKSFFRSLREVKYDLLFDLQGNTKSAFVTKCALAKEKIGFGFRSVSEFPNLLVTQKRYEVPQDINVRLKYLKMVQTHFQDAEPFVEKEVCLHISEEEEKRVALITEGKQKPLYMVCFGSKWRNKQLDENTLHHYLKKIAQEKDPYFLFIYGGKEEEKVASDLEKQFLGRSASLGNLSLPLWQALMRKMDLVIAMDSAALHLCGTTATPSFSIFGPSKSAIYKPIGEQHRSFQGSCPYHRSFTHRCPVLRSCPTGACIRSLRPEQLISLLPPSIPDKS